MSSAQMRPTATPVVYRAMWNDDRPDLHELAARTFRAWARTLHPQLGGGEISATAEAPVPSESAPGGPPNGFGGEVATGEVRVNLRRETAAHGGVSETLLELDQATAAGSLTVILRVLTNGGDSWVWVDLEAAQEPGTPDTAAVQALVCKLIDEAEHGGGRPRLGNDRIQTRPFLVEPGRDHLIRLANALRGTARVMPCVVIAHDYLDGPGPTRDRARTAARQLAGLAQVFVLPAQALNPFKVVMGSELYLQPGEARLYLPGEHEPHRHRVLEAEVVRSDPEETGRWFGRLLQTMLVDREPPDLYRRSHQLLGERRESRVQPADTRADAAGRVEALESEVEAVWEALYQAREERTAARAERDEQAEQMYDVLEDLEMAQQRVEQLQDLLKQSRAETVKALVLAGQAAPSSTGSAAEYGHFATLRQAVAIARENLLRVVLPSELDDGIARLDSALQSRHWARNIFDGLLAFEAYAHRTGEFGDFREWCSKSRHERVWFSNAKKLAMRESESVMKNPDLRRFRELPVSAQVDRSGSVLMEAHLKIANGSLAPRVYFYDDTRGSTGKVHVGFIGPHNLMPTKVFAH